MLRLRSWTKPHTILSGAVLALITSSVPAFACTSTISQGETCNLQYRITPSGVPCPWFVGGYQNGGTQLDYVQADINTLNPYPVWTTSSLWVGLQDNNSSPNLTQIGYWHYNGNGSALVFTEYTNGSGSFYPPTSYNSPSNGETEYYTIDESLSNEWEFCWNENCAYGPRYFNVYDVESLGEIHDYKALSQGSQAIGVASNKIESSNIAYGIGPNVYNANLTWYTGPQASYQSRTSMSGNDWYTWDSRCFSE